MKIQTSTPLGLGQIRYVNTLPFYHRLAPLAAARGVEIRWVNGVPTEINSAMHKGALDLAPISSLEYLNHQDQYLLLPDLCIGSRDFSASVILFSKERMEGLNGARISVSAASLSAAALLRILLKFKFKFQNRFYSEKGTPEEMLARSKACLAIGDEALFYRPKEFVYKTDLSELWWDWTGQPFCFSVWAVRRAYYREHHEEVREFHQRLKENLERNLQDLEKLLREGLGLSFVDERFPTVYGYLFNLNYALDEEMQQGLQLFFRLAHRLRLAPRPKELEFIEFGVRP